MKDCSKYLKKFYMGIGVFFIMVIQGTFFPKFFGIGLVVYVLFIISIIFISMTLARPYLKCLEQNIKKPYER